LIEFRNVTKAYNEKLAVKNMNLHIQEGEICVLLGPSGCGKSTMLKLINRMLEPTNGEIYVREQNIKECKPEALRTSMGYVIQSIGLFPHYTVYENIAVVPKLLKWPPTMIKHRVAELLALIGLEESYQTKYPSELSGGEAQRIGVARALAANPSILLMDEPFGAVDPQNRKRLQIEFAKIQKKLKKTVVFVTHDVEEAVSLGDCIAVMRAGELIRYSPPEELLLGVGEESGFVTDFLGSDYMLKLLTRYTVADYFENNNDVHNTSNTNNTYNGNNKLFVNNTYDADGIICGCVENHPCITRSAPINHALSTMIVHSVDWLVVKDEHNQNIGTLRLSNILTILKEDADG